MTGELATTAEPGAAVAAAPAPKRPGHHVQSVQRAFELLETIVDNGGTMRLSELAAACSMPLPTSHRLIRTLVDLNYLRQDGSRRYMLAPRLIRLGEGSARMLAVLARPYLVRLVDELEETVNLAMLDGDQIVYVAQAPSKHSMRMFTEVGRRVDPHTTAVGKAIMAGLPQARVREIVQRTGMSRKTPRTITGINPLLRQLESITARGYAIDDGEQELGVRCIAVALHDAPAKLALSVSGPFARMTDDLVTAAVPALTAAAGDLSRDLSADTSYLPD